MSPSSNVYKGKIIQPLRSHTNNPNSNLNSANNSQEQTDDSYYGKVQLTNNDKSTSSNNDTTSPKQTFQFGMFSLNDKRVYLQNGDLVTLQLIELPDGSKKAYNIQLVSSSNQQDRPQVSRSRNEYKKGRVDSVKGHSGYIEYSVGSSGDMKKLFFHISDVIDSASLSSSNSQNSSTNEYHVSLKPGDEVEFIISHNPRNGKYSATRIRKLSSGQKTNGQQSNAQNGSSTPANSASATNQASDNPDMKRPERLLTKLKVANIDKSGKQLVLTRQPNNPDINSKVKSFSKQLRERLPGSLVPNTVGVDSTGNLTKSAQNIDSDEQSN